MKSDRRIKVIPNRNQTDISNIICGRKIKTGSIWNFRNVFEKAISCEEGLYQKCSKFLEVNVYEGLIFSGKLCENKCIRKFVSSLVHDIPVRALFQANFGLMTSLS